MLNLATMVVSFAFTARAATNDRRLPACSNGDVNLGAVHSSVVDDVDYTPRSPPATAKLSARLRYSARGHRFCSMLHNQPLKVSKVGSLIIGGLGILSAKHSSSLNVDSTTDPPNNIQKPPVHLLEWNFDLPPTFVAARTFRWCQSA